MTINKQALRSKARSASAGEWIKESGDGWEAICSANDQTNGNFIIAHFEGPDAKANREFAQAAHPATVLALLDELEGAEKRIAELEARTVTVKLPRYDLDQSDCDSCGQDCGADMSEEPDGDYVLLSDVLERLAAAGINLTVEG